MNFTRKYVGELLINISVEIQTALNPFLLMKLVINFQVEKWENRHLKKFNISFILIELT